MTKQQVLSGALQQPHLTKSDAIVFLLNSLSFLKVWTGFQFRKASATSRIFHHMNKSKKKKGKKKLGDILPCLNCLVSLVS